MDVFAEEGKMLTWETFRFLSAGLAALGYILETKTVFIKRMNLGI